MKTVRLLLISALVLFSGELAYASPNAKTAHAQYEELSAKVRSGDATVDWQSLRIAAEVAGVEGNYDMQEANKLGIKAFNAGDFNQSLKIANEMLDHNIADGDAHFLAMISFRRLGRTTEADKEQALLDAYFQSIMKSGDGKSAATALYTVNVHEEYLVIRLLMHLNFKSQALAHQSGHYYDVMTVADDSGQETKLWFNTDLSMESMNAALKSGSGKN